MIFVDSNIPMYLVGSEHPNKGVARRLLERAIAAREILVTDAEVLQEILHRYAAIARLDAIEPASRALLDVVDVVLPVERIDVEHARPLVTDARMSARDAIHVAIMRRHGVDQILTLDVGFDGLSGIERVRD